VTFGIYLEIASRKVKKSGRVRVSVVDANGESDVQCDQVVSFDGIDDQTAEIGGSISARVAGFGTVKVRVYWVHNPLGEFSVGFVPSAADQQKGD
jgi:hypothetical protein